MSEDQEREERIQNEIIVDCYGEYEVASGWHNYLEDQLHFPFKARCITERTVSPLKNGEIVEVVKMAEQTDYLNEICVIIRFMERTLGVPLMQLEPIDVDEEAEQAIGDWHYWFAQGRQY